MLDKLHIKNFLTFDELLVEDLKRVNLIAGQNNSGKTAFLEAIRILESEGDDTVINNILNDRGVFIPSRNDIYENLFNRNRLENVDFSQKNSKICIEINNFKLIKNQVSTRKFRSLPDNDSSLYLPNPSASPDFPNDNLVYVSYNSQNQKLENLWDNIVLKPEEDDVLNILKNTIEERIERFAIVNGKVFFELSNPKIRVPMSTMGDGIKRILLIALSLANAKGKVLLIDEIEMGLHHTVIEKLWKLIFKYAKLWNIQVFVTTHSQDVLKTFYYVASEKGNEGEGKYFRLQKNRADEMEAVALTMDELELSLDVNLEIR